MKKKMINKHYDWIHKIIASCTDDTQLIACENLIKFFESKYAGEKTLPRYKLNLWIEWRTQKTAINHRHESEFAG